MSSVASSLSPSSEGSSSFVISNVDLTTANTEYTITIPINARKFLLQCRGAATIKIADTTGVLSSRFFTLQPYNSYYADALLLNASLNVFVSSSLSNQVLEVIYWT